MASPLRRRCGAGAVRDGVVERSGPAGEEAGRGSRARAPTLRGRGADGWVRLH